MKMKRWGVCMLLVGMMGCQVSKTASAKQASVLEEHAWQHRVVVLLRGEDESAWRAQLEEFDALDERRSAWSERDLVLYVCEEGGGQMRDHTDEAQEQPVPVSQDMCEALRARASKELEHGHGVYLVGKDGGIKHATTSLYETKDMFALIDSMPMRQREMRSTSR